MAISEMALPSARNDSELSRKWIDLCLSCKKCQQNCPLAIEIPAMVTKLRLDRHKKGLGPHLQTAYDFVRAHI